MRRKNSQLWLSMGIDNLFDRLLPEISQENILFYQKENEIRWVEKSQDNNLNSLVTLYLGKEGKKVIDGMHTAIIAYVYSECNIIVDYIAYEKNWYEKFRNELKDIPHFWIKMDISLEECERREKNRNTSPLGRARSHYFNAHDNIIYDYILKIDDKTID